MKGSHAMTNAIHRKRSDAGSPHVRLDEGGVASAKPLFYKSYPINLRSAFLLFACALFAPTLLQAVDAIWTGKGDGRTFLSKENWSPVGGAYGNSSLQIGNGVEGTTLEVENDRPGPFQIKQLNIVGPGAVRIVGNSIEPSTLAGGTFLSNKTEFFLDVPLTFADANSAKVCALSFDAPCTFNGSIDAPGQTVFTLINSQNATFNGDIDIPNGKIVPKAKANANVTVFNNRIRCAMLGQEVGWADPDFKGQVLLTNPSNEIGIVWACMMKVCAGAANVFGTNAVFKAGYAENGLSCYDLGSWDQTIDRIEPGRFDDEAVSGNCSHQIYGNGTLTMRAKADSVSSFAFCNGLSLVWDPVGDWTFTGRGRTHSMTGCITVKGGSMIFEGNTKFTGLKRISVLENATFSFNATSTDGLSQLEGVSIASGAKFAVGSEATAPLTSGRVMFCLSSGGKIGISPNASTTAAVVIDGVPVAAGTYTGSGVAEHTVPWIEGDGVLTVPETAERYFNGSQGIGWNDPANWTPAGLPDETRPTVISKLGDTSVEVSGSVGTITSLQIGNAEGTTELSVAGEMTVAPGALVLGTGAAVKVPAGGRFVYDGKGLYTKGEGEAVTIDGGATFEVCGGFAAFSNMTGIAAIGGDAMGGKLSVTDGACVWTWKYAETPCIGVNGFLEMTGGTFYGYYQYPIDTGIYRFFPMYGGSIGLSGTAEMTLCSGYYKQFFGSGRVDLSGRAVLNITADVALRAYFCPSAAGERLDMTVSDNANFNAAIERTEIGYGASSRQDAKTVLSVSGNAKVELGKTVVLGSGSCGDGTLEIADNAVVANRYYSMIIAASGTAEHPSKGLLVMTGGSFVTRTDIAGTAPDFRGLMVGFGGNTDGFAGVYNEGEIALSGGVISNNYSALSDFFVGYGNARGVVSQSGGEFWHNARTAHIGYYGGEGAYEMSGGLFSAAGTVAVGSENGKGTLSLKPGAGVFAAKGLTLDGSGAQLVFKVGADGACSAVNVDGTLAISPGAKLVVDASDYVGESKIRLLSCKAVSGAFADSDVTFLTSAPGHHKLRLRATGLSVSVDTGLAITVK